MCERSKACSLVVLCVLAVCSPSVLRADTEKIDVAVGEEFTISLDSNPSTGYSWSLAEPLPKWLEQVDKTWSADNPNVIGGSGTEYWTFRATAAGSATLTFEYERPWEGVPINVQAYQVTASGAADIEKIEVLVGEEFKISLGSNPSTGYSWSLAEHLPDWLEQVDKTWSADDPGLPGGGGTEYWTFRATAAGSATLTFEYERPWEGVPIQVQLYQVTATGASKSSQDGFETGDFSALDWKHQGTPWQITSTKPYAGRYCARSGPIGNDGISTLSYMCECQAGQIGFAVRVSSEEKYDRLVFRIDGREVAAWSGEQDWMPVQYPVSPGTHSFAWSYEKDKSKAVGADAAWLDEVTFPVARGPDGLAGMVLVKIPAGTFQMGDQNRSGSADEQPAHTVTLRGFEISKYETTNEQYAAYLNAALADGRIQIVKGTVYAASDKSLAQPYFDTAGANFYSQIRYSDGEFSVLSREGKTMADHPVVQVSWYGAQAFCDYYGYRLPTEAEWEYAARGGYQNSTYPWGNAGIDCGYANYFSNGIYCNPMGFATYPFISPVGHYGPQGAYGLCDMAGNAWEYCQDWFDASYYSSSPANNPTGPASGKERVFRGGSWHDGDYRVADRYWQAPTSRNWGGGFRVCR